jgi:hypothetical protein
VAPLIAPPVDTLVTLPVTVPLPLVVPAVRLKFEVVFAFELTVTDWLLFEYPLFEAVSV